MRKREQSGGIVVVRVEDSFDCRFGTGDVACRDQQTRERRGGRGCLFAFAVERACDGDGLIDLAAGSLALRGAFGVGEREGEGDAAGGWFELEAEPSVRGRFFGASLVEQGSHVCEADDGVVGRGAEEPFADAGGLGRVTQAVEGDGEEMRGDAAAGRDGAGAVEIARGGSGVAGTDRVNAAYHEGVEPGLWRVGFDVGEAGPHHQFGRDVLGLSEGFAGALGGQIDPALFV
ncbi:MAG: hypothetical protein AAFU70_10575, partial [Planctomycetota bacterium]